MLYSTVQYLLGIVAIVGGAGLLCLAGVLQQWEFVSYVKRLKEVASGPGAAAGGDWSVETRVECGSLFQSGFRYMWLSKAVFVTWREAQPMRSSGSVTTAAARVGGGAGTGGQTAAPPAAPAGHQLMEAATLERESSRRRQLEDAGIEVPKDYLCPITLEIMADPVIASDGFVYERAAIEQWLLRHKSSPSTNKPLDSATLIPCHPLRSMILEFLETGTSAIAAAAGEKSGGEPVANDGGREGVGEEQRMGGNAGGRDEGTRDGT